MPSDQAPALTGCVLVSVVDQAGATTTRVEVHNTIVDDGRQLAAQRLVGLATAAPISHLAVGTGNAPPAAGDTQLATEITTIDRAPIDTTALSGSIGFRIRAQVSSAAAAQINEAGLFTAPAHGAGTMYNRVVFPSPLPVGPGLDLIFEWDITF
jgi:hypothetical protein